MYRKTLFLMAVNSFLLLSFLQAQDTASNQLDNVVVTANKYLQKQNTTSKVVTVITKDMIDKSAGKTLPQLLNEQAGVVVNGALNNAGSVQTVYMRGASSGRTLILLDGIPVNDPSMLNNEFDLNLFSLQQIEQIEICRGAQSTLYGSDAIAGVINIITVPKTISRPFNMRATAAAGSLDTRKGNVQAWGKSNKLTYDARYAKLYTRGFSAALDTSSKENFDRDGYDGDVASARVQVQATNNLLVKSYLQYSRYKTDIDASAFADDKDFTIRNQSMLAGAGIKYSSDVMNLTANFQYNDLKRRFLNDSTDGSDYLKTNFEGKSYFGEIYATAEIGKGFTLLAGTEFRQGRMNSSLLSISSFGPWQSAFPDSSLSQSSLYASVLYGGADKKLYVELGGRMNLHSRYGSNYTYTINPSYALTSKLRVFGSIASGYKAPSLYQLYDAYSGNNLLKPEQSVNYEAGAQLTSGKQMQLRTVFFYRHIKDGIDYNYVTYRYFNYVQQIVRGLEAEVTVHPATNWTMTANYTYLVPGETTQVRTTLDKDTTYKYLLRRPNHSLNATVGYRLGQSLYVSANGKWVSRRYDAVYASPDVRLDAYFLLGAYAEYAFGSKLKLFADAQNLTGKTFYDVYGYRSIPFLLNAGVTIQL